MLPKKKVLGFTHGLRATAIDRILYARYRTTMEKVLHVVLGEILMTVVRK
jgi:hypothetical protein